jgi:hypothetical protein
MATSTNDITGDKIQSKPSSQKYRDGWDLIFNKNKQEGNKNDNSQFMGRKVQTENNC